MAQVSNSTFRTLTDTLFATNATGGITAEDLRTHFDNISDSVSFKITGKTAAPTVNDDVDGSGGNGKFAVGDFWIDETNDAIYVCLDNTNVTAVWEQINDGNVDLSGNDTGDLAEGSNLYFTDERVDDRVAAMLAGGTNIGLSYDDGSNLLTINGPSTTAQISEGSNLYYTDERVDDRVNDLLVAGSNITLTYDDGAGTITIDSSGGGGSFAVEDDGVSIVGTASTLNFTGSSVTVTDAGSGQANIAIESGGGGGGGFPTVLDVTADFLFNLAGIDAGTYIRLNNSGGLPFDVEIPSNTFSVGDEFYIEQSGSGALNFTSLAEAVTILSLGGLTQSAGQYGVVTIKFIDNNVVNIKGDLA